MVNSILAIGGPANIARTAIWKLGSVSQLVPAKRPELPTSKKPPKEIAKVRM
jgi:hypothetical protein